MITICNMPQCQTTLGCVCGAATAQIGEVIPILDAKFVCDVPAPLGRVTKLRVVDGKIVAETASGIKMIVPQSIR